MDKYLFYSKFKNESIAGLCLHPWIYFNEILHYNIFQTTYNNISNNHLIKQFNISFDRTTLKNILCSSVVVLHYWSNLSCQFIGSPSNRASVRGWLAAVVWHLSPTGHQALPDRRRWPGISHQQSISQCLTGGGVLASLTARYHDPSQSNQKRNYHLGICRGIIIIKLRFCGSEFKRNYWNGMEILIVFDN